MDGQESPTSASHNLTISPNRQTRKRHQGRLVTGRMAFFQPALMTSTHLLLSDILVQPVEHPLAAHAQRARLIVQQARVLCRE